MLQDIYKGTLFEGNKIKQTQSKLKNFIFIKTCKKYNKMGACSTIESKINLTDQNPIECDICALPIIQKSILPCAHFFHKNCLQEYLQALISTKNLKLSCPSGCGYQLKYQQIEKICKTQTFALYDKNLLEKLIQQHDQYLFCPTADCPAIYEIADEQISDFQCFFCKKRYCLICRFKFHGEKDCYEDEQSGNQKKIKAVMKDNGVRQCVGCKIPLVKEDGCFRVTCIGCGKSMCFKCEADKMFGSNSVAECYKHLNDVHGGYW